MGKNHASQYANFGSLQKYALLRSALHNLCFWFYEYVYILFVDLTPGIFK